MIDHLDPYEALARIFAEPEAGGELPLTPGERLAHYAYEARRPWRAADDWVFDTLGYPLTGFVLMGLILLAMQALGWRV